MEGEKRRNGKKKKRVLVGPPFDDPLMHFGLGEGELREKRKGSCRLKVRGRSGGPSLSHTIKIVSRRRGHKGGRSTEGKEEIDKRWPPKKKASWYYRKTPNSYFYDVVTEQSLLLLGGRKGSSSRRPGRASILAGTGGNFSGRPLQEPLVHKGETRRVRRGKRKRMLRIVQKRKTPEALTGRLDRRGGKDTSGRHQDIERLLTGIPAPIKGGPKQGPGGGGKLAAEKK